MGFAMNEKSSIVVRNFKKLCLHSMPLAILVFMIPQAFYTAAVFNDWLSFKLLLLCLITVFFYYAGVFFSGRLCGVRVLRVQGSIRFLFYFFVVLYAASYVALYWSAGGVPVIQYLQGVGGTSELRDGLYKGREFPWLVFVYIASILGRGFIPFAIVYAKIYCGKKTYSAIFFMALFFCLSAFEKIYLAWVFGPLVIYYIFIGEKKKAILSVIGAFLLILGVSVLALKEEVAGVALIDSVTHHHANYTRIEKLPLLQPLYRESPNTEYKKISITEEKDYQFHLSKLESGSVLGYMVNRLFWIPFITAYDTFYVWSKNHTGYVLFGVNRHLSKIFGFDYANFEKEVFMYQFDSGEETKGNANAFFMAEAYVGFGYVGCIIFSILIGFIMGWGVRSDFLPLMCSLPILCVSLINVSLISSLFSGGIVFFIISGWLFSKPLR